MAEPSFVTSGAYFDGSSASPAFGVPSGTAAGRVVLIPIFIDGSPLPSNPTPPSGFALAPGMPVQIPATSGSHSLYLYWKRLTGADAGSYAFSLPESRYVEAQAHLYTDVVATGTPFDPAPGAAFETTSSTTTPAISCTSAGPDRRLIFTATNWGGGTWTAPTGHTKRMQGGAGVITLTDRSWPTASSTGPVTATCTSSDKRNAWIGALIGTTGGVTPVAAAGTATAAVAPRVAARKVARVSGLAAVSSWSTAAARKASRAAASAPTAVSLAAAAKKAAPAIGRSPAALLPTGAARKAVAASGRAVAVVAGSAVAAKMALAGGRSAAALWAYRSQVLSRAVTGASSVAGFGSAAARKLAATSGRATAAVWPSGAVLHVGVASASPRLASLPRAQTGKTVAVAGRSLLATAALASARKAAPAAGQSFAAAAPSWAVEAPVPSRGSMTAGFRRGPGMTSEERQGARIAMAERRGTRMGAG